MTALETTKSTDLNIATLEAFETRVERVMDRCDQLDIRLNEMRTKLAVLESVLNIIEYQIVHVGEAFTDDQIRMLLGKPAKRRRWYTFGIKV